MERVTPPETMQDFGEDKSNTFKNYFLFCFVFFLFWFYKIMFSIKDFLFRKIQHILLLFKLN